MRVYNGFLSRKVVCANFALTMQEFFLIFAKNIKQWITKKTTIKRVWLPSLPLRYITAQAQG